MKKSQRLTKRMLPFPFVPKTILEGEEDGEEEEDEEEQVPLQGRTQLARATKQQRRRSTTVTSPSTKHNTWKSLLYKMKYKNG